MVIFTDMLTTLQKLQNGTESSKEITEIKTKINHLTIEYKIEVFLQWIPSHISIKGNELADQLAK